MGNHFKKKNTAGGGLYIALAICVLSVICIGVYSAVISIFDTSSLKEQNQKITEKSNTVNEKMITTTKKSNTPTVTTAPKATKGESSSAGNSTSEEKENQSVTVTPTPPTYTMPVAGNVTKAFSHDVLVYSETMNDYRVHNGVDLASAVGTPVKAFTAGVVESIYEDPLMGYTMVIDHGNDTKSYYCNLSEVLPDGIEQNAQVKEGQVIGGVGESNLIECAEEPHLHFEVSVNGQFVDPMSYFE